MSRLSGIPFSGTVDFGSILDGAEAIITLTVPGARLDRGDAVIFGKKAGTWGGCSIFAEISADDTVRFIATNNTGGAVNPTGGTVVGLVIPGDLLGG